MHFSQYKNGLPALKSGYFSLLLSNEWIIDSPESTISYPIKWSSFLGSNFERIFSRLLNWTSDVSWRKINQFDSANRWFNWGKIGKNVQPPFIGISFCKSITFELLIPRSIKFCFSFFTVLSPISWWCFVPWVMTTNVTLCRSVENTDPIIDAIKKIKLFIFRHRLANNTKYRNNKHFWIVVFCIQYKREWEREMSKKLLTPNHTMIESTCLNVAKFTFLNWPNLTCFALNIFDPTFSINLNVHLH